MYHASQAVFYWSISWADSMLKVPRVVSLRLTCDGFNHQSLNSLSLFISLSSLGDYPTINLQVDTRMAMKQKHEPFPWQVSKLTALMCSHQKMKSFLLKMWNNLLGCLTEVTNIASIQVFQEVCVSASLDSGEISAAHWEKHLHFLWALSNPVQTVC